VRACEVGGDGGADVGVAGVVHVAVDAGGVEAGGGLEGLEDGRRRIEIRIAEGEVKDVFGAALGAQAGPLLEHAANPAGALELVLNRVGDNHEAG